MKQKTGPFRDEISLFFMGPAGLEPVTWRITAIFLLGTNCIFNIEQQCQTNQWLKRQLLYEQPIERNGF